MDIDTETEEKMLPQWDTKLTGTLVATAFGKAQWEKAYPSVRSMADRPEFCHYYYHQALDLLDEYIKSKLGGKGLFNAFKDYDEFSYLMLRIRANVVAFVQSLHAVPDTCAHVLYYSLAIDKLPQPLKERDVNASRVLRLLERQCESTHPEYKNLCRLFKEITTGDGYEYLAALTNTSKHRSIVRPQLNQDLTGKREEKWILFLEPFWYEGKFFEQTNAREFMQNEHDRIQPLIVDIGVELNKVLEKIQSLPQTALAIKE